MATKPSPHQCDDPGDCRVIVNDIQIPTVDVDIHIRKEGPLDVTRYAEGTFVSPFDGEDYVNAFNGLDPDTQQDWDAIRVDVKDTETDEFVPQFVGLTTGVGNSPDGMERSWSWRARGPGHFLDKLPASVDFTNPSGGFDGGSVLTYVVDEFSDTTPLTVATPVQPKDTSIQSRDDLTQQGPLAGMRYDSLTSTTQKQFVANKHTLSDVIAWFEEKTKTHVWFEPVVGGVLLVVTDAPTATSHTAHYLGGGLRVIDNDALTELRPINTLVVRGQAKVSQGSVGPFELNTPSDTFAVAKARHTDLYQRAGQRELFAETETKSDAQTKAEVENEARRRLKARLDETTGGDMDCLVRSPITPYDTVEAKPTCQESPASNTPTLTYEVFRVHHKLRPDRHSRTTLNVGLHTKISKDIRIVDSWQEDA